MARTAEDVDADLVRTLAHRGHCRERIQALSQSIITDTARVDALLLERTRLQRS